MSRNISFTTTSLNRPEILEKTFSSFTNNIKDIDFKQCQLFINIDPIPNDQRENCIEICKKFFGECFINLPDSPNFTKALNWCWKKANTDWIFHLEDDWLLLKEINLVDLIKKFENKKHIHLRAYKNHPYATTSLSPSLIRKDHYKSMVDKFDLNRNPEHQIQLNQVVIINKNDMCATSEVIVKDIGREWLENNKMKKPNNKDKFTSY